MEQADDNLEFNSILLNTDDVIGTMKNIAFANNLKFSELSFKLFKVSTHFDDEKIESAEWGKDVIMHFSDEPFMLNPNLNIKQYYNVEIFKRSPDTNRDHLPSITLSANKNFTKVIAIVEKSNDVYYHPMLESLIIEDIQTKKIRSGVLIGFGDTLMYDEIKKLVNDIRIHGIIDKERRFIVAEGISHIPPVDDALVYHYKEKVMPKEDKGKIDYSKRGYISGVEKNECILEYIKPKHGTPGRNCKGVFITIKEPQITHAMPLSISPNIIKEVTDESIKYNANKNGYVYVRDGKYDIQDQMEIDEISFKTTGSIDSKITSDIKIKIKEKDSLKDAIGEGMNVEASELVVEGNVGSGAKIKAKFVDIRGQTHKSSCVEADTVLIALHRGEVTGKEIRIERLEGGTVFGENVSIDRMIGGEVIAKCIKVNIVMSNTKIKASEHIEIREIQGKYNKISINPSATKSFYNNVEKIKQSIVENEKSIKTYERQLHTQKNFIEKNKPMFEIVKCKILELMQNNVKPPGSLFAKVKDFQKKVVEYNTLLEHFKETKECLEELHQELIAIQSRVFEAKIIHYSPWRECNQICFHLLAPQKKIMYRPKEGEMLREAMLQDLGHGDYGIVRSNE